MIVGHNSAVTSVAISNSETFIVSGSLDKTICKWDIISRTQVLVLKDCISEIWYLSLSNNDKYVVSGSNDCAVHIWDLDNPHLVSDLSDIEYAIEGIMNEQVYSFFND
ncbi:hypothetical protein SteCoe_24545 [Stentor coeruleus]|uniref:Uncharacterized protein n=1 Tax=Stentor coeruleus TaxID=5963 RepID=A0A1R2BHA9_9CILI|nr:hypothetical protein SteCoe_24545 [Stentor coeruleus]